MGGGGRETNRLRKQNERSSSTHPNNACFLQSHRSIPFKQACNLSHSPSHSLTTPHFPVLSHSHKHAVQVSSAIHPATACLLFPTRHSHSQSFIHTSTQSKLVQQAIQLWYSSPPYTVAQSTLIHTRMLAHPSTQKGLCWLWKDNKGCTTPSSFLHT